VQEELGLEDFTFHDLRHHFASWFIMRGGSLPALRERLPPRSTHSQRTTIEAGAVVSPRETGVADR
jgi:integrase